MIEQIDRIAISVRDLAQATSEYALFLGMAPSWSGTCETDGSKHCIFDLQNISVALVEKRGVGNQTEMGRLSSLHLTESDLDAIPSLYPELLFSGKSTKQKSYVSDDSGGFRENAIDIAEVAARGLGLTLVQKEARLAEGRSDLSSGKESSLVEVDHIVVNTTDPDGASSLFGEPGLNIRLALDQTVEKWGGRMLFFRTGGITIEVVGKLADDPVARQKDAYWGVAFRTPNIEETHARLVREGIAVSEVRKGRKPGTCVATVKSHTLDIPTLVIGPE